MAGTAPQFSDEASPAGSQNLPPTGPIWPRDADAVQTQAYATLVKGTTRNAAAGVALIADVFPDTAVDMLDEWEATLGLPDPCAGPEPTVALRQAQITARFIVGGGQSIAYLVNFAAALGYDITITQFTPSRFGRPFWRQLRLCGLGFRLAGQRAAIHRRHLQFW